MPEKPLQLLAQRFSTASNNKLIPMGSCRQRNANAEPVICALHTCSIWHDVRRSRVRREAQLETSAHSLPSRKQARFLRNRRPRAAKPSPKVYERTSGKIGGPSDETPRPPHAERSLALHTLYCRS